MKYKVFMGLFASILLSTAYAENNTDEVLHTLTTQLSELSSEEQAEVLNQLQNSGVRNYNLPPSLQSNAPKIQSEQAQNEAPKHKSTNLSIAPSAAVTSGLPKVYSASRQGKQFALAAGATGLLWGLLIMSAANLAAAGTSMHHITFRISTPIAVLAAIAIMHMKFNSMKSNYLKNEDRMIIDFFAHKWEEKRKHITLPEYVTTRINYLANKYHGRIPGIPFDLDEAREFLSALCERTAVS